MRLRLVFAAALLLTLGAFSASAFADVIGALPRCAPWEDAEHHHAEHHHGSVSCVPRACVRDGQCSGGHCYTRRACVVREEVWVSRPGPCRDVDGDGECDRTREMQDREAGPCPEAGSCAEGSCQTRGNCDD